MKNSFVLYTDYRQHIDLLSVEEKGALLDALFKYADGEDIELDGMALMAFSFIRAQIDRDTEKYEQTCQKRKEAGAKGGKANAKQLKANQANANFAEQAKAKQADNDTDNDTDTETDTVNDTETDIENKNSEDKPHRSFVPPTIKEVSKYCTERNNGIDAQNFIDFYSSKGWMIGKNKMKDWKAAVRTWEQRSRDNPQRNKRAVDDFFADIMGGDTG